LAAVGGSAYAYHRASGSKFIAAQRSPTIFHHQTGRPVGTTGVQRFGKTVSYTHRNAKGDKTLLYAHGVRPRNVHGTKIGGHPAFVNNFKPSKANFKNMAKFNKPIPGTEQYAREAMAVPHGPTAYLNRKIEAGEAIRRTRAYVQAQTAAGKKVSAGHHMAASKYFAAQPRYTGGTVKPLRRKATAGKRRRQNRFYSQRNASTPTGLPVIGSKKRSK
jgi:hypothetical protein